MTSSAALKRAEMTAFPKRNQVHLNVDQQEEEWKVRGPYLEIDEGTILSMDPEKLLTIASNIGAILPVLDVLDAAQRRGEDVGRFLAVLPTRDEMPWGS